MYVSSIKRFAQYLCFHLSSQPVLAIKLSSLKRFENSIAFSFNIAPDVGIFWLLAAVNQSRTALSIFLNIGVLIFLLYRRIPDPNELIIDSLFLKIVETVLAGIPYLSAASFVLIHLRLLLLVYIFLQSTNFLKHVYLP